jgi:APA family basic amino acid/polyamine antiporter
MLGWLIGWNLTLEYAIGAAAVARSWAQYFVAMIEGFGGHVPIEVYSWDLGFVSACPLAAVIILICTAVMLVGAKESANFNSVVTGVSQGFLECVM